METYILPFPVGEMEIYKEKDSLTIDMSKNNFPADTDPIKTFFVYIRNIGFNNLTLDFSKCDTYTKYKFLEHYLTSEIDSKNPEYVNTWIGILLAAKGIETELIAGFLTREEIQEYLNNEQTSVWIKEILRLCVSLPLYAMMRFKHDNLYTMDEFETTDAKPVSANFYKLFQHPDFLLLLETVEEVPTIYTSYFTKDNEDLCKAISDYLPCFAILSDLTNENCISKEILECGENG